jgi:hypothetical protein
MGVYSFKYFVYYNSHKKPSASLHIINRLIFIVDKDCLLFEVGTDVL